LAPVGPPRLAIDLRFCEEGIDGIIRAHEHWDRYLRVLGVGKLEYRLAQQLTAPGH
jgi:hypothetical protein